jgi:hypothetical protein
MSATTLEPKRFITKVVLAKGRTAWHVQLGIRGRCVYLGRYAELETACLCADSSFYHAVVGGFYDRIKVEDLQQAHFNDWEAARKWLDNSESAPPILERMLDFLRKLRDNLPPSVQGRPAVRSESAYKRLPPEVKLEIDDLRRDVEALKAAVARLQTESKPVSDSTPIRHLFSAVPSLTPTEATPTLSSVTETTNV